ncbi:MAG: leucine-rich repeat protein [Clostridia bacterium]|nr:leucine-rich repeat protein [Clostridia bacterium]
MKRIIAFLLITATVAALCVSLGACSLIHVKNGIYFTEVYDENNEEIIAYRITGCSKKTKKKDTIEIPSIIRGKPVVSIGSGDGGFEGAEATKIIVPEGVTKITSGFENCPNLTTVDLPESLEIMMNDVFEGSPKVGTVENGFRYVDGWIVSREESEAYILRDDTKGIADYVDLKGIQDAGGNVRFPEGLRYIGDAVLENAVILGDVTIPTTIKNMGWCLFESAQIGGTITFPETITRMYNNILDHTKVTRVVINCTNLFFDNGGGWDGVFPGCAIGELVVNAGSITYHEEHTEDGMLNAKIERLITRAELLPYLPAAPKTLEVTGGTIPQGAFKQRGIEALILDEDVTSVGATAFAGCTSLKSLTVKNASLSLGNQAFYQTAISTVQAPSGVISSLPTAACTHLVVTSGNIAAEMLKDVSLVTDLTLQSGVSVIAPGALSGLTSLKNATVPAKFVETLPKGTLEKLTVTSGSALPEHALAGAAALTEITLSASITSIGADAFADATVLKAVRYGGSVADWAKIHFATATANPLCFANNLYVDNAVVIEALGLTTVSNYAFYGYKALAQVTFGEGISKIGEGAFSGCTGLMSLSLPAALREIGKGAFTGCEGITEVAFATKEGWYRREEGSLSDSPISDYYLTDPARAAQALVVTYTGSVWTK